MEISKDLLARQYAEKEGISIKEAKNVVVSLTNLITENLADGNDVLLKDFFYFRVKERKAKKAYSLVDGSETEIPATKTVVAKMTKHLKYKVQGRK